ncbi:ABC transporter substrate-binding protein [Clostridium magnum]|uniref:Bacterial extracellular solute-binding protein n=1 Tax=Clostridium magnum DSM 2767 TaxID=1121326 RepID=A0A162T3A7_9CLOT|nr:extracellular solute-binding protein [Clostridium magnum]KZL92189.1 bacterial extracellular solute-binding protein [Clostridium magnum DSM 2767]SHH18731.1 raffinose/stachyose/melibiose transport system substrate-binding protein [Clostridium magnum DSM 2767]
MKHVRLKYFLFVTLILVFSTFTVCDKTLPQVSTYNNNEGKVKLRCVISSEDNSKLEAFKTFQTDIKTILPNYDITFDFIKGDLQAYQTKAKVLLSSDHIPDVFLSTGGNFSNDLFSVNAVKPIDKYLEQLKFWDIVIPSAKVEGHNQHIYAVPFDAVSYQVIEINTDLFTQNNVKIPTNLTELKTAVSIFKSKSIIPIALCGKDGAAVYRMIEGFASTIDPQIASKIVNDKEDFSDETFKKSASEVKALLDMGAFPKNIHSITETDAANLFYSGKSAMYFTSSSDFNLSNQKLNGKCKLIYYPSINKAKQELFSNVLIGGVKKDSGLFISAASQHPLEAVELAVEMSKYYNKYLYEKQNNPAIIYLPNKLGLKSPQNSSPELLQLMQDLSINKNASPSLLQDNISAKASKSIIEDSSAFMTGLLSVDTYTKEMDSGLKSK